MNNYFSDVVLDYIKENPYVQCPEIPQVKSIINNLSIKHFKRGSGQATTRLNVLEANYREWIKDIINLQDFKHCYFVNGVTDAINQWIATETRPWQFLTGDYNYAKIISGTGKRVTSINDTDVLYISNPACVTGNFISLDNIKCPIILDCAYLGSTCKKKMFVPDTTEQIWFSFSKGWGLIGQRLGLVFSKTPHKSLEPMKTVEAWNYTGVEIALSILKNFNIDSTYNLYKDKQLEICTKLDLIPSDCFYIATSYKEEYKQRRRNNSIARLCISDLLE